MDLHPDKYGQAIDCDVTSHGRNRNDGVYHEGSYVRCKKCGFPMNTKRHPKGVGDGIDLTATYGSEGRIDPVVTGGCPFCGTYNYD